MAEVTRDHFAGNARNAERVLGWDRETIKKGLHELEIGAILNRMGYRLKRVQKNKTIEKKLKKLMKYLRT